MFDFGSIMGSGSTVPQTPRAGNEYILEWTPALKTLATLGLYIRPWILVNYWEGAKSVGRFEGDFFDPIEWRPEYPNPAFNNMRADDAFWAARLVSKFSNEAIRAIVAKAQYSEDGAAEHIVATLIKRRDKVLRAWLTAVNPLVNATLAEDGTLTFENAAVSAGLASKPSYVLTWSAFDNATASSTGRTEETREPDPRAAAPRTIIDGARFVRVAIRTLHPDHPVWNDAVTFTFRRADKGWQTVGIDRTVDSGVIR
jgi:hypothetical protein